MTTRSLRVRLVAWMTTLLAVTMAAVGAWVVASTRDAWIANVDRVLDAHLRALTSTVRPAGDGAFDLIVPASLTADPRHVHAIWDAQGRLMLAGDDDVPDTPPATGRHTVDGRRMVVASVTGRATIMVGRTIADLQEEVRRLILTMTGVGAAALLLVMAGGWWIIGRALTPVARIGTAARAMIDGDLTARIPTGRIESELEQLAGVLNEAFDRLYASLERQRQFTADASHDLRTPLATLRAETQWALARPRTVDEYRQSLDTCQRAAERMHALVQSLLDLARAESLDGPPRETCDLGALVPAVAADLAPLAARHQVAITTSAVQGVLVADPQGLRAAITNLLTNAVQYNVAGGRVDVTTVAHDAADGSRLDLRVRDTGPGLSQDLQARIFDRFYRGDPARAGDGGAGLGLAIVSAFARSHGGTIRVESHAPHGATFVLQLPAQRS